MDRISQSALLAASVSFGYQAASRDSLASSAPVWFRGVENRLIAGVGETLGIELHHDPIVKAFGRPDEKLPPKWTRIEPA